MPFIRTQTGSRDNGKFHSHSRSNTSPIAGQSYRGWSFDFIRSEKGAIVKRACYHVTIRSPHGNRSGYLRDFANIDQAAEGARQWIDDKLQSILSAKAAGTIPNLPKDLPKD